MTSDTKYPPNPGCADRLIFVCFGNLNKCRDVLGLRLIEKGAIIPDKVKVIEISPLLAVEADDLPDKISIPAKENVYLE